MASSDKAWNKLNHLRSHGIRCHMRDTGINYEFSINDSAYMSMKRINPYLRSIGIDPGTMRAKQDTRRYGVWRQSGPIRVRVLKYESKNPQ